MAKLITVTAKCAHVTAMRDYTMLVGLEMGDQQKVDALIAIAETLSHEQLDALKEWLDKEFAT